MLVLDSCSCSKLLLQCFDCEQTNQSNFEEFNKFVKTDSRGRQIVPMVPELGGPTIGVGAVMAV